MITANIETLIERAYAAALESGDERKMEKVERLLRDAAGRLSNARYQVRQTAFKEMRGFSHSLETKKP